MFGRDIPSQQGWSSTNIQRNKYYINFKILIHKKTVYLNRCKGDNSIGQASQVIQNFVNMLVNILNVKNNGNTQARVCEDFSSTFCKFYFKRNQ